MLRAERGRSAFGDHFGGLGGREKQTRTFEFSGHYSHVVSQRGQCIKSGPTLSVEPQAETPFVGPVGTVIKRPRQIGGYHTPMGSGLEWVRMRKESEREWFPSVRCF